MNILVEAHVFNHFLNEDCCLFQCLWAKQKECVHMVEMNGKLLMNLSLIAPYFGCGHCK